MQSQKTSQSKEAKPVEPSNSKGGITLPAIPVLQSKEESENPIDTLQLKPNNTGMPDQLKSGVENLSGMSMDHVKVHYNSAQPAQLNALAYAQGSNIHIGPGQEKHLPHEAWHVVQQAQGRVKATMQMKEAVPVNDDPGLEHEADMMGEKAIGVRQRKVRATNGENNPRSLELNHGICLSGGDTFKPVVQRSKNNGKKKVKYQLQEAKSKTLETELQKEYNSSSADASAENLGSGPSSQSFIVNGGQLASNHHIYPKSKLKSFANALSKMQVAIYKLYNKLQNGDKGLDKLNTNERARVNNLFKVATSLANKYGMKPDGSQTEMGSKFYWLPGNLFVGINSGYRTDDPGSNQEKNKPRSMDEGAFAAAIAWGIKTTTLVSNLGIINETNFENEYAEKLKENLDMKNNMSSDLHVTSEKSGEDWVLSNASNLADYLKSWGRESKMYKINNNAENVLDSFGDRRINELLIEIKLRVKQVFTQDDLRHLENLIGEQGNLIRGHFERVEALANTESALAYVRDFINSSLNPSIIKLNKFSKGYKEKIENLKNSKKDISMINDTVSKVKQDFNDTDMERLKGLMDKKYIEILQKVYDINTKNLNSDSTLIYIDELISSLAHVAEKLDAQHDKYRKKLENLGNECKNFKSFLG